MRCSTVTLYKPCLHQEFVAELNTCSKFLMSFIFTSQPGLEKFLEQTSRFLCRSSYKVQIYTESQVSFASPPPPSLTLTQNGIIFHPLLQGDPQSSYQDNHQTPPPRFPHHHTTNTTGLCGFSSDKQPFSHFLLHFTLKNLVNLNYSSFF